MSDNQSMHVPVDLAQPHHAVQGRVQTELREALSSKHESSLRKYSRLCVGKPSFAALLNYELRTSLLGALPGAAGLFLRAQLYRGMWGHCGRGVVIGRNVTIRHPHRIHLGDGVIIDDHCVIDGKGDADVTVTIGNNAIIGRNSVISCKGGSIEIGARANISVNCTFISETSLSIGACSLIAGHCYVIAGGNHGMRRTDIPIVDQPCEHRGGVVIENNCWLGAGVTVLDGVRIGRDTIVGAGAMVNSSAPPFTVVAGVPAKVIREREEKR